MALIELPHANGHDRWLNPEHVVDANLWPIDGATGDWKLVCTFVNSRERVITGSEAQMRAIVAQIARAGAPVDLIGRPVSQGTLADGPRQIDRDWLERHGLGDLLREPGEHTGNQLLTRSCRVCGCTDEDCSGCIGRTGEPCHWVDPGLCSACENLSAEEAQKLQLEISMRNLPDAVVRRLARIAQPDGTDRVIDGARAEFKRRESPAAKLAREMREGTATFRSPTPEEATRAHLAAQAKIERYEHLSFPVYEEATGEPLNELARKAGPMPVRESSAALIAGEPAANSE